MKLLRNPAGVIFGLTLIVAISVIEQTAAQDTFSTNKIAGQIEASFGVKVLRVAKVESAQGAVYAVTIMNPSGDFNEAFQVNTLFVDAKTGALIRQFRHNPSGYSLSGGRIDGPDVHSDGAAIRRLTRRR